MKKEFYNAIVVSRKLFERSTYDGSIDGTDAKHDRNRKVNVDSGNCNEFLNC